MADIAPVSSAALVRRAREIFGVDVVEVEGATRDAVTRVAVVGGVGDHVEQMALAEGMGAQAYLTGELHVRIEGEYGRSKLAAVRHFAATTGMTLLGVSHAASEHLVIETQLARWFAENFDVTVQPLREPHWWR
ncbi:Nif3-like dinuclear metal center hexameric protein [Catellatospora chokoriensis]|uniref:GTP cyclohydrolase 1 type 2 homolog n=1 Tax=Catellatospora chokoriensis TaxID=310353 RepID=A0A8J3NT53_9ACTN|nr:Nif3-like dinuclear metal center hexameric protein [Catellatospora chokoriensis]GIF91288.1 hypothetical protein Cch02nite_47320 [Catellatospora chokoriensis]